jgi:integrase
LFFGWLLDCGRIVANPLEKVPPVETRGRQKRQRRAFTREEICALLGVSGPRAVAVLLALYTGLRRGELQTLLWGDVHLDGPAPFLRARASTTKNKKTANIRLHRDLETALRKLRPSPWDPAVKVLRRLLPRMPQFKKDLEAAGIEYVNARGFADFHSLRVTFITWATSCGGAPRAVQEAARHSALHLTMSTYTDPTQLPTTETIFRLPSVVGGESHIESHILVPGCPDVSQTAESPGPESALQSPDSQPRGDDLSPSVPECPDNEMVAGAGFEPATSRL